MTWTELAVLVLVLERVYQGAAAAYRHLTLPLRVQKAIAEMQAAEDRRDAATREVVRRTLGHPLVNHRRQS